MRTLKNRTASSLLPSAKNPESLPSTAYVRTIRAATWHIPNILQPARHRPITANTYATGVYVIGGSANTEDAPYLLTEEALANTCTMHNAPSTPYESTPYTPVPGVTDLPSQDTNTGTTDNSTSPGDSGTSTGEDQTTGDNTGGSAENTGDNADGSQ